MRLEAVVGGKPQRAIFLLGPTAVGKTRLAVELVQRLPLEIISVDSAMVYRGMDIGTGKPGPEVLARAPHRLIDIRDPEEPYSAGQFRLDARREMADIARLGKIPLLVGGTGLYFRALREGLSPLPPADRAMRRRLNDEAARYGWERLHARLAAVDPPSAARIRPSDPQRIQRALEVYELSGCPLSEHHAQPNTPSGLGPRVYAVALAPPGRGELHRRIARRFADMLARGLVDEVRTLRMRPGVHSELPAVKAVGYRQVWEHLEDETDRQTMERRAVSATRQLAKRQLTWLRSEPVARWLNSDDPMVFDNLLNALDKWIGEGEPH